jgi:hypothetical protein
MGIKKNVLERDGDKLVASYSEVADEATGLVVRHLWSRMEYGVYRTPFDGAHLEIGVEQYSEAPDTQGVMPIVYTIRDLRMAEATGHEPCEKWGIPSDKVEAAAEFAIKAIELFASTLTFAGKSVRNVVTVAPKLRALD